ncbi:hypothetical protein OVS_04195 [Mycoplasma ovis str. Michigan]|uniref:Uncharacterized protein n=1 Tax=Mycoplasma ovis str. Michigan TaxID=1415773 RepID=A0ABN4BMN8_9MOLU|nr:hypothetical protein OVS_04195 [Mycoplasma ovis str. Michigan]
MPPWLSTKEPNDRFFASFPKSNETVGRLVVDSENLKGDSWELLTSPFRTNWLELFSSNLLPNSPM